jgi:hypothetical protein
MLSHYTGRAGLEGIARTKTLWATNFLQLNDKTEIEYGLVELTKLSLRMAWAEIEGHLRADDYRGDIDYDQAGNLVAQQFRKSISETPGESLYVFSFAKAKTEHQERRGMLTLWDRYTGLEGYCLQFDRQEVLNLLSLESSRRNYVLLDLANVHYGIDENDRDFVELKFQLAQRILAEVQREKAELGIRPQYDRLWAFSALAHRMLHYCARHKDPFFEDEREARIMAVPAERAESRIFVGLAFRKEVKKMSDGRKYIDLGEDWTPNIEPRRIIVGPRARRDLGDVLSLFETGPEVYYAEFPI